MPKSVMKPLTLHRRTIALLAGVLVLTSYMIIRQQIRMGRLREPLEASQAAAAHYEVIHQRDENTNNQLRNTNELISRWLEDQSLCLEKYEGSRRRCDFRCALYE